eukprot:s1600_g7.t1
MSGQGRGGARHKAKPHIDTGLLFKVLSKHKEVVADMKGYEVVSRNSAVDPKALHGLLPPVNDLLGLVPSAEVHPGPLRQALYQMMDPDEGRAPGNFAVSCQEETLKKVQPPDDEPQPSDKSKVALKKAPEGAATMKKDAATLKKDANTLKKDAATLKKDAQESRKLKKTRSDVSADSLGIPKELASPLKASDASPPRIWNRKKFGQKQSTAREVSEDEGHVNLQEAMVSKKPAAAMKKAKAASKPLKRI